MKSRLLLPFLHCLLEDCAGARVQCRNAALLLFNLLQHRQEKAASSVVGLTGNRKTVYMVASCSQPASENISCRTWGFGALRNVVVDRGLNSSGKGRSSTWLLALGSWQRVRYQTHLVHTPAGLRKCCSLHLECLMRAKSWDRLFAKIISFILMTTLYNRKYFNSPFPMGTEI